MSDTPHIEVQAVPNPATTSWVPVGPGPASSPSTPISVTYVGAYDNAHVYNDGDIVIGADGLTYQCVKQGSVGVTPVPWNSGQWGVPQPPVAGQWLKGTSGGMIWSAITPADVANISYGTSLPASPYNGQEAILVDSVTNPTYQWRFRYNSGSTSPYKWECVGGSHKTVYAGLGVWQDVSAVGGGVWTPLPTPLAFVAPRSGDYTVIHGAQCGGGSPGDFAQLNAGTTGGVQGANLAMSQMVPNGMFNMNVGGQVNLPATDSIMAWYFGTASTIMFANRWMQLTPVRVS
jgi:hypothetical protein